MTLALRGISAGHGGLDVVRDLDLTVDGGVVCAVVGPNGAGKTTMMRVAAGLHRPRTGGVLLDGADITTMPVHERSRRGICHVGDGGTVFPSLTVAENLRLFARPGAERVVLAGALDLFPSLAARVGHRAGTLSGGERQMLALARAVTGNARVVLLDEMSLGLAAHVVDAVHAWVAVRARAGAAVLLVDQDVVRARSFADHVVVLHDGRIRDDPQPARPRVGGRG